MPGSFGDDVRAPKCPNPTKKVIPYARRVVKHGKLSAHSWAHKSKDRYSHTPALRIVNRTSN